MKNIFYPVIRGMSVQWLPVPDAWAKPERAFDIERCARVRTAAGHVGCTINRAEVPVLDESASDASDLAALAYVLEKHGYNTPYSYFSGTVEFSGAIRPHRGLYPVVRSAVKDNHEIVVAQTIGEELPLASQGSSLVKVISSVSDLIDNDTRSVRQPILSQFVPCSSVNVSLEDAIKRAFDRHGSLLIIRSVGSGVLRSVSSTTQTVATKDLEEYYTILSVAGMFPERVTNSTPLRIPHHTVSEAGMIGKFGTRSFFGEVTLAHLGILVMDEFNEFKKNVVDRVFLAHKDKFVDLSSTVRAPADFTLIGAIAPCSCGFSKPRCTCPKEKTDRHLSRVDQSKFDEIIIL